jgi:hypothetical protein
MLIFCQIDMLFEPLSGSIEFGSQAMEEGRFPDSMPKEVASAASEQAVSWSFLM